MFAVDKPTIMDKMHYGVPSGGSGYGHQPQGGHSYSSIGQSAYGYGGESSHGGGGGKRSIALSALTLLAFLFFLHILQTCLQEQMDSSNTQVVMMTAARIENKAAELLKKRKGDADVSDDYQHDDEAEKKNLPAPESKRDQPTQTNTPDEKDIRLVKIN